MAIDEADLGVRKSYLRRVAANFINKKLHVLQMTRPPPPKEGDYEEYDYVQKMEEPTESDEKEDSIVRFNKLQELIPIVSFLEIFC